MTVQFSTAVRNAQDDIIETTIGTGPTLELRTGAQPANCAAAATGTVVASLTLPADWMGNASGGVKALLGSWTGTAAATGTPAHYRITQAGVCHMQGSVTATGGGGNVTIDNVNIVSGQTVTISTFSMTEGNA